MGLTSFLIGRYTGRRAERRRIVRALQAAEAEAMARRNGRPHTATATERKGSA
jgi:hypothetical protein